MGICRHSRGVPKWHIGKYSVEHFFENWPIVEIFQGFYKKSVDFYEFSSQFWNFSDPK